MYIVDGDYDEGEKMNFTELIRFAGKFDESFASQPIKTTSEAARIIREAGYKVREEADNE